MKKITLALGGGGSKGIAHIGVIKALQANEIKIAAVAGTSIGSVIASMLALGLTPEKMADEFRSVDQSRMFGAPFSDGAGFLGYGSIKEVLMRVLGEATFDDVKIPLKVVSVDLVSDSVVEITQGRLIDAVLASIAIPGFFPPRYMGDMVLVDGGVMDPVPVRSARSLFPDLPCVAVPLSGKYRFSQLNPIPMAAGNWSNILVEQFSRTTLSKAFTVMSDAVDTTSRQVAELRLEIDRPDIIIRPKVEKFGILDTVDIDEMVRLGQESAAENIGQVKRAGNVFFGLYKMISGEK